MRTVIVLLLLLVAGAIVNVAVAWGCVCRLQLRNPLVQLASANTMFVSYGVPLATCSYGIGIVTTQRRWEAMGVTWASRIELLEPEEFMERLPSWSAFHNSRSQAEDCAAYGFKVDAVSVGELGAGLPVTSLVGARALESAYAHSRVGLLDLPLKNSTTHRRVEVPFWPIWPGFAINTLFYAVILWLLFAAPFALRRHIRIRRGLCPACAYPVGDSPVCTECGKPVIKQKAEIRHGGPADGMAQKAEMT